MKSFSQNNAAKMRRGYKNAYILKTDGYRLTGLIRVVSIIVRLIRYIAKIKEEVKYAYK